MKIQELFQDQVLDYIHSGDINEWAQRAPNRQGYLTFAHTSGLTLVNGLVEVVPIVEGLQITYTAERNFNGLWPYAWRDAIRTERPFNRLVITDATPGEMVLYANEDTIFNPLTKQATITAIRAIVDNVADASELRAMQIAR